MDQRLVAFLAVARAGRVTQAARQLNLSVSSVSQQITSLESDFGVRLFVRSNRGVVLSPAGATLRSFAENIEADWRSAFRAVRQSAAGDLVVHMSASHTVAEIFLPRPLGLYRRLYPAVQLNLTVQNSAAVLVQVETGQVDFGIAEGRLARHRLHVRDLWRDELGLIVSASHPWAGREGIDIAQLQEADLILREEGSGTRRIFESALHDAGHALDSLHVIMELSSLRAIVAMVRHGVGVSVLSRMVAEEERESGIAFVPLPGLRLKRQIYLLDRGEQDLGPAARQLSALLVKESARRS
ncbi:MAG: LysR family transcriptional regulator [Thermaerobacter sp.]|nr:LysR family transcriptional regulator [Thermaerobacter sp.]